MFLLWSYIAVCSILSKWFSSVVMSSVRRCTETSSSFLLGCVYWKVMISDMCSCTLVGIMLPSSKPSLSYYTLWQCKLIFYQLFLSHVCCNKDMASYKKYDCTLSVKLRCKKYKHTKKWEKFGQIIQNIKKNILGLDLKLKHLVVKPFQVFTGTPTTLCIVWAALVYAFSVTNKKCSR